MRWKKICLAALCLLPFVTVSAMGSAGATEKAQLRYFMQKDDAVVSRTPYGDNEAAGHYVDVGDAKLYYEVYGKGKGEPVAVFHGGGVGSPYEMGRLIDGLRKDHEVIVVSTRGHGRSEIGHTPLSYPQKGDDMAAVIRDALGVDTAPIRILGFSDGAYAAYELAVRHPDLVDRIAAIGAGTLEKGYFPAARDQFAALRQTNPRFIAQMERLAPEPARLPQFFDDYMAFWSTMEVGRETFGKITCPVLFIVGDEDDHAPVATVLAAHQMTPDSRLLVVPKA